MAEEPFTSVPPERVDLRRSPPPKESLLPPRALPAQIPSPLERALVMLACGLAAWAIGYFTQPPRRTFRREDFPPR